jgi:hypothetical protein
MTNQELNELMRLSKKWLTQYNANHPDSEPKLFFAVHPFLGMIGIPETPMPGLILTEKEDADD